MSIERDIIAPLRELIDAGLPANPWLSCAEMEMYVRIGSVHVLPVRGVTRCIDIANANVVTRGKGTYTRLLDAIEPMVLDAGYAIYLENVIEERLQKFYERRGYVKVASESTPDWKTSCSWPPSFFMCRRHR